MCPADVAIGCGAVTGAFLPCHGCLIGPEARVGVQNSTRDRIISRTEYSLVSKPREASSTTLPDTASVMNSTWTSPHPSQFQFNNCCAAAANWAAIY
jgi:hypothetical protein